MKKGSIQQEYIIFINIYASNIGEPIYIKQVLTDLKGENDINTITGTGDYESSLLPMVRSSRQEINTETLALNDTSN